MASSKKSGRWSQRVTQDSDALDLEPGVFTRGSAREIAVSLKRSAQRSRRRKADPYRSALSMLSFYINRAGQKLPAVRRKRLEQAKAVLRELFGRSAAQASRRAASMSSSRKRYHHAKTGNSGARTAR